MSTLTAVEKLSSTSLDKDNDTFTLLGKPVRFSITSRASKALACRQQALWVEMELYFSCLVRKQLRFYEHTPTHDNIMEPHTITNNLQVSFRPVVTQHCMVADVEDKPDLKTMPVEDPARMIPRWLKLDFRSGQWCGEFGY